MKRHLARVREDNGISFDEFVKSRRLADALLFNIGLAVQIALTSPRILSATKNWA